MKLFAAPQIRAIDEATVLHEPIASIDLMERAADALFEGFVDRYSPGARVLIFAGGGNNGGDGLALARKLAVLKSNFEIYVYLLDVKQRSADNKQNLKRLLDVLDVHLFTLTSPVDLPRIDRDDIVVDALFGTGLSRPVQGLAADVIGHINKSEAEIFAVDIPSGLFAEDNTLNTGLVVEAAHTLTFQFPKLVFLLSDSAPFLNTWEVCDITLSPQAIACTDTPYALFTDDEAQCLWNDRLRFSHKGTYGHALIIAGRKGMMGAALLATKACLRSGAGLVTAHVPCTTGDVMHLSVPEALVHLDRSELMFTDEIDARLYDAVGVGPGLGTKPNAQNALHHLLKSTEKAMVLDADALNIIALHKTWLNLLPVNSILTPHPKEFDRLTKEHHSAYERLQTQIEFTKKWQVIVVLKGAFSSVVCPDGSCYFNSTGNPGMATAGSGDVLTGIITGLLAQGYKPAVAAQLGVWWHGKAGDLYAQHHNMPSLLASDLIEYMANVDLASPY